MSRTTPPKHRSPETPARGVLHVPVWLRFPLSERESILPSDEEGTITWEIDGVPVEVIPIVPVLDTEPPLNNEN